MEESRRLKVFISMIFVMLVTILASTYTVLNPKEAPQDYEEEVMGEQEGSFVPYIVSLPPIVGYEGEEYLYFIRVVDEDTDIKDLTIEYVEGPNWLSIENMVLSGEVPLGSSGSYKIVLRVSDGMNSSTQESYILVISEDE
jgi:hypothetical protein